MKLDRFDKLILDALQKDGRVSNVQLANAVSLSESACLRRVRALEEAGLIDRYVALVSQAKVGLPGSVFVQIGAVNVSASNGCCGPLCVAMAMVSSAASRSIDALAGSMSIEQYSCSANKFE